MLSIQALYEESLHVLQNLICIPSFSTTEHETADYLITFFTKKNIPINRNGNNVWCTNLHFDDKKKTIFLNSHHDTVKPNIAYTKTPFEQTIEEGKLYGLGSTDAGASVVSLIACFLFFYEQKNLPYNLLLAITAEEEISGKNGVESLLPLLPQDIVFGIVGEPTQMDLALAERGLLVIDCLSTGFAGHAARNEGDNAIYKALKDIEWFKTYQFEKVSSLLGENKMTVTIIHAGLQHNVIPASCEFTVDIRLNELYTHEEVLNIIATHTTCVVKARSFRLKSTHINIDNPIVQAGLQLGKKTYGSPTTSDKALLPFPTLKCGPGYSGQSHSANEFVLLEDIHNGISGYIQMLQIVFNQQ